MAIVPITYSQFHDKRFKRTDTYAFAEHDLLVPVVLNEISRVVMEMPIGFAPTKDGYLPVAVLGFGSGVNSFVAANGQWEGRYIPAYYRGYPFSLAATDKQGFILCIDEKSLSIQLGGAGSGALGADDGEPFFLGDGQPSEMVRAVTHFLQQLQAVRARSLQACALLDAHGLLAPWTVQVQAADGVRAQPLTGLFSIDSAKLNKLEPKALSQLRDAGALLLAYGHLLSAQHLVSLAERANQVVADPLSAAMPMMLDEVRLSFAGLDQDSQG